MAVNYPAVLDDILTWLAILAQGNQFCYFAAAALLLLIFIISVIQIFMCHAFCKLIFKEISWLESQIYDRSNILDL